MRNGFPTSEVPTASNQSSLGDGHSTVVWIQPGAPAKPALGAPCNGCGLCCLTEPCPLGVLVSRRRSGACIALRWSDHDQRYWCGMVANPGDVIGVSHPWLVSALVAVAKRSIAQGIGCDAQLDTALSPPFSD